MNKTRLLLAACACCAAQLLSAQTSIFDTDCVIATVDQQVFTTLDVRKNIEQHVKRINSSLTGQKRVDELDKICRQALDAMINKELIYLDFKDLKAKIPSHLIQERLDNAITANAGGDVILFEEKLYQQGTTMAEFREKIHKDIAIEMLMQNKVRTGVSISDDEIENYYQQHRFDMTIPMRYRLAVLLLKGNGRHAGKLPDTIAEIQTKLRAGTSFADLAKQYSEDPAAEKGGDQGWLEALNPHIRAAIHNLNRGEVTPQPLTIGNNAYFIQVLDIKGGGVPPLDSELKEKIKQRLTVQASEKKYHQYLRELHTKYAVRRFDGLK